MKKLLLSFALGLISFSMNSQCLATSTPTNDGTDGDAIDSFVLNGVSSIGNSGTPSNGYNSFSSPVRTLVIGGTYTFAATTGGPYGYDEGFAIWIDLNHDGIYANSEQVYASTNWGTAHSGSLTIPFTAANTTTVNMRVRCAYYTTIANNEACLDDIGGYGETEDYILYLACPAASVSIAPSNTLLCLGESTTLTATGGQTFTWTGGAVQVTNGVAFTPTVSGSYTVTTGVTGCPSSSATAVRVISVTSTPLAVAASISNSAACNGQTVQLNAFGANNYTWMPGNFYTSSPVITASANTTFTLTGYNGNGCPGFTTVALNVTSPNITIVASNTNVCPGTAITLTASGANSYTWTADNSNGNTITVTVNSPTNISVNGLSSNCPATAGQFIMVNAAPDLSVTATKTLVCENMSVTLTAQGASDSYQWSSGPVVSSAVVSPSSTSVYSVTGSFTSTGCSSTSTIEIIVFKPVISINPVNPVACPGTVITLTASGGTSGYSWTPGGSLFAVNTVTVGGPSSFTATAFSPTTGGLSCPGHQTVSITAFPAPTVAASADRAEICKGEMATITASGAATYTWINNNTSSVSIEVSPNPGSVVYTVQGTDANGCVATASVLLKVNFCAGISSVEAASAGLEVYPNPNNGSFVMESSSELTLTLFNQTGQLVKVLQLSGQATKTVSITDLPVGIYFLKGESQGHSFTKKIVVSN